MSEFLSELRENWTDPYWWDGPKQILLLTLCAIATGVVGVAFAYLEGRARKAALA